MAAAVPSRPYTCQGRGRGRIRTPVQSEDVCDDPMLGLLTISVRLCEAVLKDEDRDGSGSMSIDREQNGEGDADTGADRVGETEPGIRWALNC